MEDPLRCLLFIRVVEKEVYDADFWCLEEPVENNRPNSLDKSLNDGGYNTRCDFPAPAKRKSESYIIGSTLTRANEC